jgi:hypothetical protein
VLDIEFGLMELIFRAEVFGFALWAKATILVLPA